jgi:hypothetical protein
MASEVQGVENRWLLFETAPTIVTEKFEDGRAYASNAIALANAVIEELRQIGVALNTIDTTTGITYLTPPESGSFTGTAPTSPDTTANLPVAPSDSDVLQDTIRSQIINSISNQSSAIPESVETAIFNRESERALLVHHDTLDNISAEWAKRGFTLPNAILASLISQAETDFGNKRLDVSRDIAIKNFELSDANVKFAVQQGIAYIGYKVTIYKAEVDAEIARIDAIIKKYLGDLDAYKTDAQVFTSLADINVKEFDAALKQEITKAGLLIKNVEIGIKNYEMETGLRVEVAKAIGSILAQVVAGSLASISASASVSASDSGSYNYSTNPSY